MSDLEHTVYTLVARTASVEPDTLGPATTIKDLGVTSLDVIEMLFELEDRFDVELSDREINFATASIGDLVAALERGLAAKATKSAAKLAAVNHA